MENITLTKEEAQKLVDTIGSLMNAMDYLPYQKGWMVDAIGHADDCLALLDENRRKGIFGNEE